MSTLQFATFFINETLCGMNILQIREVISQPGYSPVPQAPSIVIGLMNLRGQILTVIDTRRSLGIAGGYDPESETCIVLKTDAELESHRLSGEWIERLGNDAVGLIVDRMSEVVEIDERDIDASPANLLRHNAEFIRGVVKLDQGLVTILRLERVLAF